ncbi:SAM-dependent methyltransferase [Nocardiopsis sediminis]|uniref:SAM-dependent methyltransferase n=1 Tax=Nocardiopsis sediminis TaxID=1778267 RepID=A0ABV8FE37_9ACTN
MTTTPVKNTYSRLDFNSPMSPERARRIAEQIAAAAPATVTDFGCGWGELLLRVLEAAPTATGTGVDTDAGLLERGREEARRRGLAGRATFVAAPAETVTGTADLAICVGASHAFGGTAETLRFLRDRVGPGGTVLIGEGFWQRRPSAAELAAMWPDASADDHLGLGALVDLAIGEGFRPLAIDPVTDAEWDAFESAYLADFEHRALALGPGPEAGRLRKRADDHRNAWLRGYRGVLSFAYLTLVAADPA